MSTKKAVKRGNSSSKIVSKSISKKLRFSISTPSFPTNTHSGVILVTGAGDVGQLGLGSDVLEKKRPAAVILDEEIVDVIAGGMHTVCLTKDGNVITFGCNDEGALGRVTPDDELEFTPGVINLPDKAMQISAGDSHTAVLLSNGKVFAWGTFRDSHGSMGLTINGNERLPFEILPFETVVKIASGADHLVMLTNQGYIYTCGNAEQGQLGRVAQRNSDRHSSRLGIKNLLTPTPISTKISLKLVFDNIWAGTYSTFAKVHTQDQIMVFGLNNYNQIGMKSASMVFIPVLSKDFSSKRWKQICGSIHHTILLDDAGKVYCIGRKDYGRLGLGKDCKDASEITEIPGLKKCVYIGCGNSTSFAVTEKGDLYAWGMGTSGQLGTGEEEDCLEPTLIKGKQLQSHSVQKVSSGGQHTVILATPANNNVKMNSS